MMPDALLERTYEGKKEMLLMENVEDKEYLTDLFKAIYDELTANRPKQKGSLPRIISFSWVWEPPVHHR